VPGAARRGGEVRYGDGVRVGYLPQEHGGGPAAGGRTALATFRAGVVMHEDEARAFLDKFLFSGEEVHRRVAELSYGERAKLALATLVASGSLARSEEHTSELQSPYELVCRLLLEKKKERWGWQSLLQTTRPRVTSL